LLIWLHLYPDPSYALVACMTVLIIACPCALGLATPMSIMVGVGKAAEYGVLIRNGEALQQSGRLTTVVVDKTGTVTSGKPTVTTVISLGQWPESQLLGLAAAVEAGSEHPLAAAVLDAFRASNPAHGDSDITAVAQDFEAISGHGVQARVDGQQVWFGNQRLMEMQGIDCQEVTAQLHQLAGEARTPVLLAIDKQLAGIIAVADPVKPDSRAAIRRMHDIGLRVVMITGDHQATADAVAAQVGIDEVLADVLPQHKADRVADLQQRGEVVAMVGDGINDAPALARSNVGFAIGSGTDVAIESADITLMRGSLHGVVDALQISRATLANIYQNLFGAFFYNALGIPVAAGILYPLAGVMLNPMLAGAAMALSSLTVVSNANRLRLYKVSGTGQQE